MKREWLIVAIFGIFVLCLQVSSAFTIEINITSGPQNFSFQADNAVGLNVTWGDGNITSDFSGTGLINNSYSVNGTYNVTINGSASRISFYEGTKDLLIDILSNLSDVTGINSTQDMFNSAFYITSFTAENWFDDVSGNVTNMNDMFSNADAFNQNLTGWNTSAVTTMNQMFYGAISFNGNVSTWDTSSVTDMNSMFRSAAAFNQDIDSWDVSSVITMGAMFLDATVFNQNLSNWDVSSVQNMADMFGSATAFNGNVSTWNVSSVTTMLRMFQDADAFNQNLTGWNTGSVLNMNGVFKNTDLFNGNLSNWDTSSVTDMGEMFRGAVNFNQDIGSWDVSGVSNIGAMFRTATSFNQNLSNWDTSSVTVLGDVFQSASSFNGNISNWNLTGATSMSAMFSGASVFNQNISGWDVSNIADMDNMFSFATSFNQDIGNWNVSSVTSMVNMFNGLTLSTTNYDSLLVGWNSLSSLQNDTNFSAGNSQYSPGSSATARANIISTYNWSIYDGGINDSVAPNITINSPTNTTYTSSATITFNVTASDDVEVNACVYSLDEATNQSMTNLTTTTWNATNTSMTNAVHNVTFYCNDTSNNINSSTVFFTVNYEAPPNSPGGGGGSSVKIYWTKTIVISEEEFREGYTKAIIVKTRIMTRIKGEDHYIGIRNISTMRVIIEIASNPQNVTFEIGEEKKFDLDSDSYYDLYVKLNSIGDNDANITVKEINEPIPSEAVPEADIGDENPASQGETESISTTKTKKWGIILVVVIILGLIFFKTRKHKRKR